MRRAASTWSSVFVLAQATSQAASKVHDIPVGIVTIICAFIAGLATVIAAWLTTRRKDTTAEDANRLAVEALLVTLLHAEADSDGDAVTKEEMGQLAKHLRGEVERKHRGREG